MIRKSKIELSSPEYWRSLEQLADDPRFRRYLEDEFPSTAPALDEPMDRRRMLALMGASFAFAGLASCRRPVEHIVPYVDAPENVVPGIAKHYATTMPDALSGYGLVVESHEGRPTKIEGNEQHPSTGGASHPHHQAAILSLYDPDRSHSPRRGQEVADWEAFKTFWGEWAAGFEGEGDGLAVLSAPFSSPTLFRLAEAFKARYPSARWVTYQPVGDENRLKGLKLASGQDLQACPRTGQARVILALDCDFLGTESDSIRASRGWAERRRVNDPQGDMSRLYAAESVLSLTGLNADHRLAVKSGQIAALAGALAAELASRGLQLEVPQGASAASVEGMTDDTFLRSAADDLTAAGAEALVVCGRNQPPVVHALVYAINQALGSNGNTVEYYPLEQAYAPDTQALKDLAAAIEDVAVDALLILGGNPVYDAPHDLRFDRLMKRVEVSVHLSDRYDETSAEATWHLPLAHFLESWGDVRSASGELSVIQPLIEPLYGALPMTRVLGLLADSQDLSDYERVRETWRTLLQGRGDFETEWRRTLHDGILAGSRSAPVNPPYQTGAARGQMPVPVANSEREFELVLVPSYGVGDGSQANNAWLQELPDPVTKLVWDNAAILSPASAAELGVKTGDNVVLKYMGGVLEAPVWIQPGQCDGSITLALGYGRSAAGRVGNGVGRNAYKLMHSDAPRFGATLLVQTTRRKSQLVSTQDHGSMEGREIVQWGTLDEFREHPEFAHTHTPQTQLFDSHPYERGPQWGMAIDLNVCTGCNACVTACQSENNVPVVGKTQVGHGREMHWIRVDRYFGGPQSNPSGAFQPMPCQHCENAPCEQVCPVAATVHDSEGLNVMVYNRCIGTRYCSNNCPYKVRRFNFFNYTQKRPEVAKMAANPDVTVRSRGVMEKCSFCLQRISEGKKKAKQQGRPLADGDVVTACQQACPTQAIVFGDISDPDSRISQAKRQARNYILLGELNNRPRNSYLARLRHPHPELEAKRNEAMEAAPQPAEEHQEAPAHGAAPHGGGA
ncbi:MAG TPA: TAT-variant-translocated molybdopterin oxidoreductase [Acidobacteriota bacterium]|nr:TAT-variant-translocated molybdopterin oxidoreductase [Acidobacteriota bacterium]